MRKSSSAQALVRWVLSLAGSSLSSRSAGQASTSTSTVATVCIPFASSIGSIQFSTQASSTSSQPSFLQEMINALLPEKQQSTLPGIIRGPSPKKSDVETSGSSALSVLPAQAASSGNAEFFSNILKTNPLFRKVNANIQDMHEKWETSDSPLVHRIQDAIDDSFLVQESEAQIASKLIQQRHPGFDMVAFLRGLKEDVPIVIRAYLSGDEQVINEYGSPEMVERLTGIIKHQKEQGLVPDPTLLDTSEVELVDLKMLDDSPVVVVQFTCQQVCSCSCR